MWRNSSLSVKNIGVYRVATNLPAILAGQVGDILLGDVLKLKQINLYKY